VSDEGYTLDEHVISDWDWFHPLTIQEEPVDSIIDRMLIKAKRNEET
jgi:hypothetical protein